MKFLVVLALLAVLVAWVVGRQGRRKVPPPSSKHKSAPGRMTADVPAPMLACARCGLHLPVSDAMFDDTGRPFCGAEHRLAGPG